MLSVPPAFVLSQDQTLYYSCISKAVKLFEINPVHNACVITFCAFFILCLNSFFFVSSKEFQGSLLFSCIVQFSRCCFKAFPRLLYYITSFRFCQVLFSSFFKNFFVISASPLGQLVYYITFSRVCQVLFQNFFQNFFSETSFCYRRPYFPSDPD